MHTFSETIICSLPVVIFNVSPLTYLARSAGSMTEDEGATIVDNQITTNAFERTVAV